MDPGGCSILAWIATIVLAFDNSLLIVLYTRNLLKFKQVAIIIAILGAVAGRGLITAFLFQFAVHIPIKLIGGTLLIFMVAWQMYSQSKDQEKQGKDVFWAAVGSASAADLLMSLDSTIVLLGEMTSILLLIVGVLINIPILIAGTFVIEKVVNKWKWVLNLAPAVLFGTAIHMILSDSMVAFQYATVTALFAGTILFIVCLFWEQIFNTLKAVGSSINNPGTNNPELSKPEVKSEIVLKPKQVYI